jgi:hypothetical protein
VEVETMHQTDYKITKQIKKEKALSGSWYSVLRHISTFYTGQEYMKMS